VFLFNYLYKKWFYVAALSLLFCVKTFASQVNELDTKIDTTKLHNFIDELVEEKMADAKVAGTTIALVDKDSVLYAKGHGFSNIRQGEFVDANETLFRWGSVSKTVTWTAIMQLVEQGKVSLDADINDYLIDVKIPEAFGRPIYVSDLLAHTSGFEDLIIGHIFEKDPSQVLSLTDYLKKFMPERVRPSGEIFSYSNYSTALAGQIVANVSQMSFEDYVEKNIFIPLNMSKSTFREPLPPGADEQMAPNFASHVSKSFDVKEGKVKQIEHFTYLSSIGPAGAMSSTALDMAKYALSHLDNCDGLLSAETCLKMRQPQLSMTSLNRFTINHGFFQHRKVGGHLRFGHNGATDYFYSEMGVYPELNFAIVISTNTATGKQFNKDIEKAIITYLFGEQEQSNTDVVINQAEELDLERYVGSYLNTRRPQSNIETLYSLILPYLKVSLGTDSSLLIDDGSTVFTTKRIAKNLFADIEENRHFDFVEDSTESLRTYDKIDAYLAPQNRVLLLLLNFTLILVVFTGCLILSMKRFSAKMQSIHVLAIRRALICSLLCISFIIFLIVGIIHDLGEYAYPYNFPSIWVKTALAIGLVSLFCVALPIRSLFLYWANKQFGMRIKLIYTLAVLIILLFYLQLNSLHLIGFNYS